MRCVVRHGVVIGFHAAALVALGAAAQQPRSAPRYGTGSSGVAEPAAPAAAAPHRVTLALERVTLREALAAIARAGGVSVAYSSDVVPVERRVSVRVRNATVEQALDSALAGSGIVVHRWSATQIVLEPGTSDADRVSRRAQATGHVTDAASGAPIDHARVAVDDSGPEAWSAADGSYRLTGIAPGPHRVTARRVGYAPETRSVAFSADSEVTIDFALRATARSLDEVVVTGTVAPTEVRALPTPITIISANDIQQSGVTDVDALFRGTVPGAVDIDNGTHDGYPGLTFRGAIDFNQGVSGATAKIYVDGVELAYGNAITQIDPKSIDRIEITRGPQASTLYGAGAMVGVIQIFTKHGTASLTRPDIDAQVAAGGVESQWARGQTLHQDHTLGVSAGTAQFDYAVRGSYTSTGEWAPEYDSKRTVFSGRVGGALGALRVDLTGQYGHRVYHAAPIDPYMASQVRDSLWHTAFDAFYAKPFHPNDRRTDANVGLTASFSTAPWWEHHIVLGFNGYDNPRGSTAPRFTRPADSLRAFGEYRTSRSSVSYNTTLSAHLGSRVTSALTVGADYWTTSEFAVSASQHADGTFASAFVSRDSYDNTGVFAQLQLGLSNRLFLTAGVRGDHDSNFGAGYGSAIAPRAGVSYAGNAGGVAYKLRASYGVAIQPPEPFQKAASNVAAPFSIQIANPDLGPERQRGGDAGVDLYFGQHVSVAATYYNQRVDDMITSVVLSGPDDTTEIDQNRNIGRIKNTGVELQSTINVAPLSFTGTYSVFHSTVQRIDAGALGDGQGQYHVGDRLLLIPRSSGGFTAGLELGRTRLQAGLTYIGSFRNYDRIAYGNAIYGGQGTPEAPRAYIIDYPSVYKWNASVTQALPRGVSAFVRVDNLTNSYASEIDNITAVYGRLTVIGLRGTW